MKYVVCLFILFTAIKGYAQDDVFITEEEPRNIGSVYIPITVIENQSESPLNIGAGLGFSYLGNPFGNKAVYLGGEISYVHMGSAQIYYNNDDYLENNASIWSFNLVGQYRLFRNQKFGVYPEVFAGILSPAFTSTLYYYDYYSDSEQGSLKKIRMFATPSTGIGVGVKLFHMFDLKFRYSRSLPVKQFHPSEVTVNESGTINYPFVKYAINRFEIFMSISLQ